ncbi:hypothetical protein NBRC116590_16970 [Pelagimonas sp. KU-00592-HH]
MESQEGKLETADFAVAVFSADDRVESRGVEKATPRDNTVFELGLFAGARGEKDHSLQFKRGGDIKVPSDLAGISSLRYKPWSKARSQKLQRLAESSLNGLLRWLRDIHT